TPPHICCILSPSSLRLLFLLPLPRPPSSPLFPYTTLFRSQLPQRSRRRRAGPGNRLGGGTGRGGSGLGRVHLPQHSGHEGRRRQDRKSTRLNSSHVSISYAVFCLKKKKKKTKIRISKNSIY